MPEEAASQVTRQELETLRQGFHEELTGLKEQIRLLQARASALDAQLARIEPMVEARASRTEKLVYELQGEISKLTKAVSHKHEGTTVQYSEIQGMLKTLLERSE